MSTWLSVIKLSKRDCLNDVKPFVFNEQIFAVLEIGSKLFVSCVIGNWSGLKKFKLDMLFRLGDEIWLFVLIGRLK